MNEVVQYEITKEETRLKDVHVHKETIDMSLEAKLDARFGVHFFESPDIFYLISTIFDPCQLLSPISNQH